MAKITVAMDNTVIEDPTPPPRRKKEQKSVKKPPVIARTKKDFTQLHQDFAPSEVTTIYGLWYELYGFYQLLEQRKLSDVTMTIADDANNASHDFNIPEKPRRKRKHFKLVKCDVGYV